MAHMKTREELIESECEMFGDWKNWSELDKQECRDSYEKVWIAGHASREQEIRAANAAVIRLVREHEQELATLRRERDEYREALESLTLGVTGAVNASFRGFTYNAESDLREANAVARAVLAKHKPQDKAE